MDIVVLRLLFVAGLLLLGGLAIVVGIALSTLSQRWSQRSRRAAASSGDTRTRSGVPAFSRYQSSSRVDTGRP